MYAATSAAVGSSIHTTLKVGQEVNLMIYTKTGVGQTDRRNRSFKPTVCLLISILTNVVYY